MNKEDMSKVLDEKIELYGKRINMLNKARLKLEAPAGHFYLPAEMKGNDCHVETSNIKRFPHYVGKMVMEAGYQRSYQNSNILNEFSNTGCMLSEKILETLRNEGSHKDFLLNKLKLTDRLLARSIGADEYLSLINGDIPCTTEPFDCFIEGSKYEISDDGYQTLIKISQ